MVFIATGTVICLAEGSELIIWCKILQVIIEVTIDYNSV